MTDVSSKPQAGTVAPVVVQPWYKHATIIVLSLIASIPVIISILVQFQQLPGLPTNVLAWITSVISVLGAVYALYQKLFGTPMVTPTAASKLIQTEPEHQQ